MAGGTFKLLPTNYSNACLYSLRGVVEAHGVRESGWWIFKNRTPIVRVRVREDQLAAFNNIARNQMSMPDGNLAGIASVLELGMTEEKLKEYPVGAEIGITFGYSGPIDQFFIGKVPLMVMKLQVMSPGIQLDNEVLSPA